MYTSSVEAMRSCCNQKNKRRQGDGRKKDMFDVIDHNDTHFHVIEETPCHKNQWYLPYRKQR